MAQDNLSAEYEEAVRDIRRDKDSFFVSDDDSPIPLHLRGHHFSGLRYFPPDRAYRVEARLERFPQPETVPLGTTRGQVRPHARFGILHFSLNGQPCQLTAFTDPGEAHPAELFVPFRDATSGQESYGAGRYLEAPFDGGPTVLLDFNLAYSPWCAYNDAYTCVVPPAENVLPMAVRAGEQTFDTSHGA